MDFGRPPFPYLVTAALAALGFHVSRSVLGNKLTGLGLGNLRFRGVKGTSVAVQVCKPPEYWWTLQ